MKAVDRNFETNYRDLVRISDIGEDIYGSELGREIIRAGCPDCALAISVSLLKMQLEQEWFFRRKAGRPAGCAIGTPEFSHMLHRTVCECVSRRMERYRGPARRGAILDLIDSLEGLEPERKVFRTEGERSMAARLPEEELISLAAHEAQRHAGGLWAEWGKGDGREAREPEKPVLRAGCHATAAALALAAYGECSDLRCAPELLADISAAAAEIAYAEPEEAVAAAGYMELLTGAASLVDLAGAPAPMAAGLGAAGGAEFSRQRAAAFFRPFAGLFSAGLRLAMGAGAAELLAGAAAAVKDFVPHGEHGLAGADMDILPQQGETAIEEESFSEEESPWGEGEFT